MTSIQEFDVVEATYRPRRTEGLRPAMKKLIGKRLTLLATLVGSEDPAAGRLAFAPYPLTAPVPFALLPGCDLAAVALVRSSNKSSAYPGSPDAP
jgi:hypothetical protein